MLAEIELWYYAGLHHGNYVPGDVLWQRPISEMPSSLVTFLFLL